MVKRQILVVDDDKLILAMLTDILSSRYDVITAQDGQEALQLLGHNQPRAILSDQHMPKLTGVELLEKSLTLCPDAVRMLVTATDSVADVAQATNRARVHRVIVKPFREVEVLGALEAAFRERELQEENARLVHELQVAVAELQAREQELERELQARAQELKQVLQQLTS